MPRKKSRITFPKKHKVSIITASKSTKITENSVQSCTNNISNTGLVTNDVYNKLGNDTDIDLNNDADCNPDVAADCDLDDDQLVHSINGTTFRNTDEKRNLHECFECDLQFDDYSNLSVHMRMHTVEMEYECDICHKRYKRKDNCIGHLCIPIQETTYKCNICNKQYIGQSAFTGHKCMDVGKKQRYDIGECTYECYICHKLYKGNENFITHVCIQTGAGQYKCNICHTRYNRRMDLTRHKCKQSRNMSNNCEMGFKGSESAQLKPHRSLGKLKKGVMAISSSLSSPQSSMLGTSPQATVAFPTGNVQNFVVSTASDTNNHNAQNTINAPSIDIPSHISEGNTLNTKEKRRLYECSVCHLKFDDGGKVASHRRTHIGELTYECNICNRCYIGKYNFDVHVCKPTIPKPIVTSPEKTYKCKVCNTPCIGKDNFTVHMRAHIEDLPFECDICHKRYNRKSHVALHKRRHTCDKSNDCEMCRRRFEPRRLKPRRPLGRPKKAVEANVQDNAPLTTQADIVAIKDEPLCLKTESELDGTY